MFAICTFVEFLVWLILFLFICSFWDVIKSLQSADHNIYLKYKVTYTYFNCYKAIIALFLCDTMADRQK